MGVLLDLRPHFPDTPMPLPTFQGPAGWVHCRVMLPFSCPREEHDNSSPNSAVSLTTSRWSRMGIQRGPDVPALGAKGSFGPALSFPFHLWPIPSPVLPPYHHLKAPLPPPPPTASGSHRL